MPNRARAASSDGASAAARPAAGCCWRFALSSAMRPMPMPRRSMFSAFWAFTAAAFSALLMLEYDWRPPALLLPLALLPLCRAASVAWLAAMMPACASAARFASSSLARRSISSKLTEALVTPRPPFLAPRRPREVPAGRRAEEAGAEGAKSASSRSGMAAAAAGEAAAEVDEVGSWFIKSSSSESLSAASSSAVEKTRTFAPGRLKRGQKRGKSGGKWGAKRRKGAKVVQKEPKSGQKEPLMSQNVPKSDTK